jgi:hypothetical protein
LNPSFSLPLSSCAYILLLDQEVSALCLIILLSNLRTQEFARVLFPKEDLNLGEKGVQSHCLDAASELSKEAYCQFDLQYYNRVVRQVKKAS